MLGLGLSIPAVAVRRGRGSSLEALIASLYGNGEEGAFFVPKPQVMGQQVLFQDAAGTTPVTADGDPVGLMLDLSKGGFGEQVNPDPDLSQPELWEDVPAHVQFVDGELVFDTNIDAASIFLPVSIKPGMKYHILMTVEASTSGEAYVGVGLSRNKATSGVNAVGVGIGGGLSSTQVRGGYVEVPSDWPEGDEFYIFVSCSKRDFVYRFSHLTVTELPGNHATQEVSGSRPIYRTDGVRHWLEFDGVDDYLSVGDILDAPSALTVSAAVGLSTYSGNNLPVVFKANSTTSSDGWRLYWRPDQDTVVFRAGGGGSSALWVIEQGYSDDAPLVLTGTHETGDQTLRINGQEAGSDSANTAPDSYDGPVTIGASSNNIAHSPLLFYAAAMVDQRVSGAVLHGLESYLASITPGVTL